MVAEALSHFLHQHSLGTMSDMLHTQISHCMKAGVECRPLRKDLKKTLEWYDRAVSDGGDIMEALTEDEKTIVAGLLPEDVRIEMEGY